MEAGDGLDCHTLFINKPFSKSVPAAREWEEDAIHFIDTRDTFKLRSQTVSSSKYDLDYYKLALRFADWEHTWIFPPEHMV